MPYKMDRKGMDEINQMLGKIEKGVHPIAAQAVYIGAGIVADEVQKQAKAIKTAPFKYASGGATRLPSPEEKEAVINAAGIARFDDEGGAEISTSVGFGKSGYTEIAGKVKPIPLIAASINHGTSFMGKQPFIRKAASNGGKKAISAMKDYIEKGIESLTKK